MPRLDAAIRNIAIWRQETGESQNAVAARYNVHRSMMSRLWQRYQQSGSTNDGSRSGWIGPARAPTPITTTNHSGVTSTYEYEWQIIPQVRIHGLIESLSRRVQTVLQINGGLNRCWICRCVNERLQPCVPLFHQCNKQKHFDKWWSTLWTSSHHKSRRRPLHPGIPAKTQNCNSISNTL
jgi:hypothetical protein